MGPLPLVIFLLTGGQDVAPAPDQQSLTPATTSPASSTTNPATSTDPPTPITGIGRLDWAVKSTIGPASLLTGVLSSTWGTAFDHPREYGESFEGFAKRYGLRLTGVAASNVTEAGLGMIWGEDPRYHRDNQLPFGRRIGRTVKMTFLSENRDGSMMPAYARYIAIGGTNVLSDAWRPDSDRGPKNTTNRIAMGFGGRLLGNLWEEFWPDVKQHVFLFNKH
jgi:hypothetical protein